MVGDVIVDDADDGGAGRQVAPLDPYRLAVAQVLDALPRDEDAAVPVRIERGVRQRQGDEALVRLRRLVQLLHRVAGRGVHRPGGLELPRRIQPVEGAEDAVLVDRLAAEPGQESQRAIHHLDGGEADARGAAQGAAFLPEGLVVTGTQAPHPVVGLPAVAGEKVHVREQGILGVALLGRGQLGVGWRGTVAHPRAVVAQRLRQSPDHFPPGGVPLAGPAGACLGFRGAQDAQPKGHALGRLALRIAAQVLLVLGLGVRELPGALARKAQQFLRVRALGEFRLALQLGKQRKGLGVVTRGHRGAHLRHHALEHFRRQGRIAADLLHRHGGGRCGSGVHLAGHRVVPDGEPGARIILQCQVQDPVRLGAALDRTDPQPVPLLALDHGLGDEHRRLQALVRELDGLGGEGAGLRVQIDGEVADRIGRLSDHDLAAASGAVDQSQPNAPRIRALRHHEALVLPEGEREGDLPGREGLEAGGGKDVAAAGDRGHLGEHLREGTQAAVRQGRELDTHLLALAGGQVGDEAHRAVEYHGQVDRVFVVGDLDDVHQARVGAGGKLRQRLLRAAGGQENEQDE